ncbi:hypothetical protein IM538_18580 [Cytobacillus suaedae]|nr:hypothetical protein IM538_18580 [Cytobacillus suaedae]
MDITLKNTLDSKEINKAIQIINQYKVNKVNILDLSEINFVKPYGLTLLLQLFEHLEEIDEIILPKLTTVTYMARMGFFNHAEDILIVDDQIKEINSLVVKDPENQSVIDLTKIIDKKDIRFTLQDVHEKTRKILINELHYDSKDIDDFTVMLSELLTNIPRHSQTYGYVCAQTYRYPGSSRKYVSVCISDMGIGMKESFIVNGVFTEVNDKDALRHAVIEGKSSKVTSGGRGGNGYKGIKEIVNKLKGGMSIKSGISQINFSQNHYEFDESVPDFPGTQVEIILPQKNI